MAFWKGCSFMAAILVLVLQTSNAVSVPGENWSAQVNACIRENNIATLKDVPTIEECKLQCVQELGTLCGSIDYNPTKHNCNLHIIRSDSVDYTEPCYNGGNWVYAEREVDVDENWSGIKHACIKQNNYKALNDILTIDACKELCAIEKGILCMSIDYNPVLHKCNLHEIMSDSTDYTEPCYNGGVWVYAERTDEPVCDWPNGQIYWPHASDCHMFIQCTPHGPQEMTCAPGTAWSQSLLTCDYVGNTECEKQTPPPPPAPSCPEPFKMRGDECFFVTEDGIEPLNWDDSRQKCLDMGADLAMPHDMVDFVQYIKESYPDSKSTIWLGATDIEVEQEWKWVSGDSVPAEMWKPWPHNQPSGDGNCMEIHYWPKTDFYMNDWHCNKQGHYACEFDMSGK